MEIKLTKPFAANGQADEADTLRVKRALNRLGYYTPYEKTGMTGIPDREVFRALAAFQKDRGLKPTGRMKPEDETVTQLRLLGGRKKGEYIWCTAGDSKVRKEHAALEGQICDWEEFPAPGDEPGCRCWAAEVSDDIEKEELPEPETEQPKIPGTDIPDQGVPEQGWPGSSKYDPYRPSPNPNADPSIVIVPPPGSGPRMPIYEELPWPSGEEDV